MDSKYRQILAHIKANPGCSPEDIAEATLINEGYVRCVLPNMAERKLIERANTPADTRKGYKVAIRAR